MTTVVRITLLLALLVVLAGTTGVMTFDGEQAAPGATEALVVRPFFWLWIAAFGISGARKGAWRKESVVRWWQIALTGSVLVAAADTMASFWLSVRCCGGFVAEWLTLPLLIASAVAMVAATFCWERRF